MADKGISMKGAMSNFYHEARAQVKGMKARQEANKRRSELRQEREEAQKDHPIHLLRLDGRAMRLHRNDAASYALGQGDGLVAWSGDVTNMIDRFDGRALLESAAAAAAAKRTPKERELEEMLCFERYRDLVRLQCLGLTERQGVAHAEQENVAVRAHARAAAQAAVAALQAKDGGGGGGGGRPPGGIPAGTGQFSAVGFMYDAPAAAGAASDSGSGSDSEDGASSDEEDVATAEDADMDARALRQFGIEDYSSMLRWSMRQEAAAEAESFTSRRPRRQWGRKKAALRAKRLVGQGMAGDPGYAQAARAQQRGGGAAGGADLSWIPERRQGGDTSARDELERRFGAAQRGSPDYGGDDRHGRRRSRSRSRSRGRSRSRSRSRGGGGGGGRSRVEYITSFTAAAPGARRSGLPPEPHRGGAAQAAPREALPGIADPALEGPALLPREAVRLHGVRPEGRVRSGAPAPVSGRVYRKPSAAPAPVAPVDRSKETPAERIKRLMAAQLNKKAQQDAAQEAQRRQQDAQEQAARAALQRAADDDSLYDRDREHGRDPGRYRSRSRSPRRHYGDSSRRDRSRSPDRSRRRSPSPYDSRRRGRY